MRSATNQACFEVNNHTSPHSNPCVDKSAAAMILAPGRCGNKSSLRTHVSDELHEHFFREIATGWMPETSFDDKWTLAQGMALCRQSMLTQIYVAI